MSIDRGSPESARSRPTGDPLQMTEAEKRAAEWEARHDVAARGHRAGPETLQHYFAHERVVHADQPPPPVPHAEPPAPQPVQPAPTPRPARLHRLLRRLLGRAH